MEPGKQTGRHIISPSIARYHDDDEAMRKRRICRDMVREQAGQGGEGVVRGGGTSESPSKRGGGHVKRGCFESPCARAPILDAGRLSRS